MGDDITYIRTQEGFAYLVVVIDLFSRRIVGPLSRFAGKSLPGSGIDAKSPNDRFGRAGVADGGLAPKAQDEGADPLRPRQPIYQY